MTKIISWNINGIGTLPEKNFFNFIMQENPDIICLQETKTNETKVAEALRQLTNDFHLESVSYSKSNYSYSGVAILSREKPLQVSKSFRSSQFEHDGRVIISEFPSFVLYNCYFPTGASGKDFQEKKRTFYKECTESIKAAVSSGKEVILCGDFNTARDERDVAEILRKKIGPGAPLLAWVS